MMFRWLRPLVTAVLAAAMVWAQAQADVPAAGASASAPLTAKPGPRLQTPAQLRDSASMPGDLRPEEHVTPQIVIPLRKAAPPTQAQPAAARRGTAASSAGIDDSVARYEAQSSAQARAKCRAGLTKKAPAKTAMT